MYVLFILCISTADRTAVHVDVWNNGLFQSYTSYRTSKQPSQYSGDITKFLIPIQRRDCRRISDRDRGAKRRSIEVDGRIALGLANINVRKDEVARTAASGISLYGDGPAKKSNAPTTCHCQKSCKCNRCACKLAGLCALGQCRCCLSASASSTISASTTTTFNSSAIITTNTSLQSVDFSAATVSASLNTPLLTKRPNSNTLALSPADQDESAQAVLAEEDDEFEVESMFYILFC